MHPARLLALTLCTLVAIATPAAVRAAGVRVIADNDYFNFWETPASRPDFGYTDGTKIAIELEKSGALGAMAPGWMFGDRSAGRVVHVELAVEQAIYAPWRLPPDRPYAGWLGFSAGWRAEPSGGLRRLALSVGASGEPSLGAETQRWFHKRFGFGTPPDWSHQFPSEPAFTLEGECAWQLVTAGEVAGVRAVGGPQVRARLGTVTDDVRLSAGAAIGWDPAPPWSTAHAARTVALYATFAVNLDVVARAAFLDGPAFNDGDGVPGVRRFVPEAQSGVALQIRRARFEYRVMRRAKEYARQPTPHTYSTLSLTWTPVH